MNHMVLKAASLFCLGLFLLGVVEGCKGGEKVIPSKVGLNAETTAPTKKLPGSRVARIVFVDQEKCCACTRKRIDTSWKALMAVLGFPPALTLDRYHLDTQEKQAEPFLEKRAIVTAPGIYFLDSAGNLLELLQGEVTEAQIRGVIR
jgi:hypothetical protein